MAFPFLPGGALLAIAVLSGAMVLFGLALRTIDRAVGATRRSVLPGLVSGFRGWSPSEEPAPEMSRSPGSPSGSAAAIEVIDLTDRRLGDEVERG